MTYVKNQSHVPHVQGNVSTASTQVRHPRWGEHFLELKGLCTVKGQNQSQWTEAATDFRGLGSNLPKKGLLPHCLTVLSVEKLICPRQLF